jgi:UDP-glucuronate 4-epimerase
VRPSVQTPLLYQDVNVRGTLNLLEACRKTGIGKFIFASSSSVYGINGISPFGEDDIVNHPVSPYAASKTSGELFCYTYNHLYKLPVVILRLFTVYGPRQRPEMAIHRFTRQIDNNEVVSIFGDGAATRDYTYIEDIIDGFISALNYYGEPFQIFNLGGGRTISLKSLITVIEKSLNKKAVIEHFDPVAGDVPATIADISKAKSLLNFEPKIDIEEGILRFVRWFRKCKENINESPGSYQYVSHT